MPEVFVKIPTSMRAEGDMCNDVFPNSRAVEVIVVNPNRYKYKITENPNNANDRPSLNRNHAQRNQ